MSTTKKILIAVLSLSMVLGTVFNSHLRIEWEKNQVEAQTVNFNPSLAYEYEFDGSKTLAEASRRENSTSNDWWLRSGGKLIEVRSAGRTLQGSLKSKDPLRLHYAKIAPVASDNGYHPQNIFRMLSQRKWEDFDQSLHFVIRSENVFNPENSHEWNAVSLLERYQDENNYYYVGLRMDGNAVIKKKRNGQYFTLATKPVFSGSYDRYMNPNILPKDKRIGIKSRIYNDSTGVVIEVYVDKEGNGAWTLAARAVDSGSSGGSAISSEGYTGIYSDYMDLEFSNYKVWLLNDEKPEPDVVTSPVPSPAPAPAPEPEPSPSPIEEEEPASEPATTTPPAEPADSEEEPAPAPSLSLYGLSANTTVSETGSIGESGNSNWWVNSGGYFAIANGIGKTIQGRLPDNDKWRLAYASANPTDTENGYQPQNIFRLLTKSTYKNYVEQAYFKMNKYNVSSSPNRDGHNGILFFNRYKDGNNLYYTGIRVDGKAVIKKKVGGTYYTLKMNTVYSGSYSRSSNPNLIPTGKWIGLRSEVKDLADGSVSIKLYMDTAGTGDWKLVAEAIDNGSQGAKVSGKYSVGVRTDFADVEMKEYSIKEI